MVYRLVDTVWTWNMAPIYTGQDEYPRTSHIHINAEAVTTEQILLMEAVVQGQRCLDLLIQTQRP